MQNPTKLMAVLLIRKCIFRQPLCLGKIHGGYDNQMFNNLTESPEKSSARSLKQRGVREEIGGGEETAVPVNFFPF